MHFSTFWPEILLVPTANGNDPPTVGTLGVFGADRQFPAHIWFHVDLATTLLHCCQVKRTTDSARKTRSIQEHATALGSPSRDSAVRQLLEPADPLPMRRVLPHLCCEGWDEGRNLHKILGFGEVSAVGTAAIGPARILGGVNPTTTVAVNAAPVAGEKGTFETPHAMWFLHDHPW